MRRHRARLAPLAAGAPFRRPRQAGSERLTPRATSKAATATPTSTRATRPRHVAFLRAINVGGHVVTMERLRTLFAFLPVTDVETFIASGNVVFTTTARDLATLERRIADHLESALGYAVATFVRTMPELATLAAAMPFVGVEEGHAVHVGFLHALPGSDAIARVMKYDDARNAFVVDGRTLWWWSKGRSSESGIDGGRLERALGLPMTMRSVTTLRRLVEKYGQGGSPS